ncbi:hypothetical protein O181_003128 [Austropuccinia psidii MF-1]|uniref:Putative peroxiredoxin n=1 Tax=Austropuccinia psidii MF-1 TaxID=1389203 RepID=A0A9Q3BDU6_9BASI|nr:hypothetical protein [Austropuccinia psidii MF-1]
MISALRQSCFLLSKNIKLNPAFLQSSSHQFQNNKSFSTYQYNRFNHSNSLYSNMTLKVGDTIPSGQFTYIPYTPELSSPTVCGNPVGLKTDDWKSKKIILFGVPGAFTKVCSVNHLPPYIEKAPAIKAKGVDKIYCIATNDAFVMSGWGRTYGSNEHVEMLSDWTLKWLDQAGLSVDLTANGLGKRSARFAMIIDDLKVTHISVESQPGGVSHMQNAGNQEIAYAHFKFDGDQLKTLALYRGLQRKALIISLKVFLKAFLMTC